ncbi:MAG: hypothetical protein FWE93_05225 [Alphaproteobacteria bacterium]|nr:hypothetical protein [Alphaproteobacteria bacterium]
MQTKKPPRNKDFWYYVICGVLIAASFVYIMFPAGYGNKTIEHKESVFNLQDKPSGQQNSSCPLRWERFGGYICSFGVRSVQDFEKCFNAPITKGSEARNFLIKRYMQDNQNKPEIRYIMPDTEGTYVNASPGHPLRVFVLKSDNGGLAADVYGVLYVQRDVCNISSKGRM